MSYCRITGNAKGLPRPNYFPILPPISPLDAKRFCRITGKSFGLPSHRYTPVILAPYSIRSKCKITHLGSNSYGMRRHTTLAGYKYMMPIIDQTNAQQKDLITLLNTKCMRDLDQSFVYIVTEKKCGLVFPAQLEAAVRDGDICDVLFANDSILLRMNENKDVSVDLQELNSGCSADKKEQQMEPEEQQKQLYEGEGPRQDAQLTNLIDETITKCGQPKNMSNPSNFEESCENESKYPQKVIKTCSSNDGISKHRLLHTDAVECIDMIRPAIESWSRNDYSNQIAQLNFELRITTLPAPYKINAEIIESYECNIAEYLLSNTTGFEVTPNIDPLDPTSCTKVKSIQILYETIQNIKNNQKECLLSTLNGINSDSRLSDAIPHQSDVLRILENYSNGVETNDGLLISIGSNYAVQQILLPGCISQTSKGQQFVCGRSIIRGKSIYFQPGITIKTSNGMSFIPAIILPNESNKPATLICGVFHTDKFVCGQVIAANNASKFIPGETVQSADQIKFIPGVYNQNTSSFVCGQVLEMPGGTRTFVPGQMLSNFDNQEVTFFPGQSVFSAKDNGWTFVHGEVIGNKFVAGKSIICKECSSFVPGYYMDNVFVPGIVDETGDGQLNFTCGLNMKLKHSKKFVLGQVVTTKNGGELFLPGRTNVNDNGSISFTAITSADDIQCMDSTLDGTVIDPNTSLASTATSSVFGQLIQTSNGIEFQANQVQQTHESQISSAKAITGKMVHHSLGTKFIPGILRDDGFIPGQLIWTEEGEKFIEGQIVETIHGMKFVPGKVSIWVILFCSATTPCD